MKRGDPLGFINILSVAKYQKIRRGDSFETLKIFEKKFAVPKKIERGKPFGVFRFCRLRKKLKNERGTLCSKFALVERGLSELISFCKKWYIRDEPCGLTKKKKKKLATVIVALFSLKEKAPTKNIHCRSRALFTRKPPTKNILVLEHHIAVSPRNDGAG